MPTNLRERRAHTQCPFCRTDFSREAPAYCAGCSAPHHLGCVQEHGGCASCGRRMSQPERPDRAQSSARQPIPSPQGQVAFDHFMLDLEEYAQPDAVRNPLWFFLLLVVPVLGWLLLLQAAHAKSRALRVRARKARCILGAYPSVLPTREQLDLLQRCEAATTQGVLFVQR